MVVSEECTGVNSTFPGTGFCFTLPSRIEMVRSMKSVVWDRVVIPTDLNARVFEVLDLVAQKVCQQ
jgi:hypothetical protein